ncbi:MAG: PAS domain-containing protein [Sphingomonas sp.]
MAALDALPAAIYLTDAYGNVTHHNRACESFTGRTPRAGRDRWCVSHKLFTSDGDPLPHDRCPMALALKQGREIRGIEAIAERPDGSRVRFIPYPTLLHHDDGSVAGAFNMLVEVSESARAIELRAQAERCRRLGSEVLDRRTLDTLQAMASEYDEEAARLETAH